MGRMKDQLDDLFTIPAPPAFGGQTYREEFDYSRLGRQCRRVFSLMRDGQWRTLEEISDLTGDPPASVSARLRDLRKDDFGGHVLERRPRGPRWRGLHEYRLAIREEMK